MTDVSTQAKTCAHETCSCLVVSGSKYCSDFCEDSEGLTTLTCDCGHTMCKDDSRL